MEPAIGVYGRDLPPGYYTDDTSMSLAVMESYVRLGKYDLRDIAGNFVQWFEDGKFSSIPGHAFDIGGATVSAMRGLKRGSLRNGGESSQGNGSIMRFAPTYIIARAENNPDIMMEISDLTHCSSRIRALVQELASLLDGLLGGSNTITSDLTSETAPNSGWAFDTVAAAKWAMANFSNFRDGMLAAVNLGGDSDSIGAVYGQLAGAYYGFGAVPVEWITVVKDKPYIDRLVEAFIDKTLARRRQLLTDLG
jgi:ADP-ribosyl-[dinitrogen reductase] hydrolase